jgi:hypothetical protein
MPGSDGIFMCAIVPSPITVVLKAIWATSAFGWADSQTFPLYHPSPNLVSAAPDSTGTLTALQFRVTSSAMTEVPQVGQSIGFFDQGGLLFRRKKLLSVFQVSTTAYDVTVDTSNGASDTSYTPVNGQACCPWSDSLNTVIPPVVSYFDTLGPGEQFANFFDPGLRQKRSPPSPSFFPNVITNRMLGGASVPVVAQGVQQNQPPVNTLFTTTSLFDVQIVEPTPSSLPLQTPVGVPGVSSYMFAIGATGSQLVVFPE